MKIKKFIKSSFWEIWYKFRNFKIILKSRNGIIVYKKGKTVHIQTYGYLDNEFFNHTGIVLIEYYEQLELLKDANHLINEMKENK